MRRAAAVLACAARPCLRLSGLCLYQASAVLQRRCAVGTSRAHEQARFITPEPAAEARARRRNGHFLACFRPRDGLAISAYTRLGAPHLTHVASHAILVPFGFAVCASSKRPHRRLAKATRTQLQRSGCASAKLSRGAKPRRVGAAPLRLHAPLRRSGASKSPSSGLGDSAPFMNLDLPAVRQKRPLTPLHVLRLTWPLAFNHADASSTLTAQHQLGRAS